MTKEKLKKLPHIFSGIIILLHSLERFESGHNSYLVFLICGITFLLLAIFHHRISHKIPSVDIIFYFIESLLSFVIAFEYFSVGKQGLPIVYVIAGILQIIAIFMFMKKSKKLKS